MNLEELQSHFDKLMHQQNNQGISDFEGYSPYEMTQIIYFTFEQESPVKLQKLSDSDYQKIPILNQVKYLARLIDKAGEIKLTKKGFLPTKIVSELYQQGFMKDELIEKGYSKLYKETDSITINLIRILLELSGITKKRKGKLSLTKSGEKIISGNEDLLKTIIETFTTKFNWAYYDGYGENQIGQLGWGFSLILLSKYGNEKRLDSFYAEKYFKAYPRLLNSIEPTYGTLESYSTGCYSLRTFDRFLDYFGLIKIDKESKGFNTKTYITKTDLFDRLIKCSPHKTL
ncbi:MAG: hypothetical protein K9J16_00580 [Melioribacteraceae bacterium]|nr:hypothetical protein [Melioribacteraceae bacterium]MCF8354087.1 hypothetical protein [Melioribacteraceae bacterium]MCF8393759.1 hypothetical protein [Melioribacteraceae bacterium]MCF8419503.1 hypothetical protein [Melioribacteraceae bacterium]